MHGNMSLIFQSVFHFFSIYFITVLWYLEELAFLKASGWFVELLLIFIFNVLLFYFIFHLRQYCSRKYKHGTLEALKNLWNACLILKPLLHSWKLFLFHLWRKFFMTRDAVKYLLCRSWSQRWRFRNLICAVFVFMDPRNWRNLKLSRV